jgi:hypothetical protein
MTADELISMQGESKGADVVPSPSLDQAREFARQSKVQRPT